MRYHCLAAGLCLAAASGCELPDKHQYAAVPADGGVYVLNTLSGELRYCHWNKSDPGFVHPDGIICTHPDKPP